MSSLRRRRGHVLSAAMATGVLAVAAVAGPAQAVPVSVPGQAFITSVVDATYPLPNDRPAWSIAATQTWGGGQPDLVVSRPDGSVRAASAEGFGVLDWVAVDTHAGRLPVGRFDVRVTTSTDFGRPTGHVVQLVKGGVALAPGGATVVGSADRQWLVDVRDMRLAGGEMVHLQVGAGIGAVYVLRSDATTSITWSPTRATAEFGFELPKPDSDADTFGVDFTAPGDDVYGLVFEARSYLARATPVQAWIVG
jgi:hypothetical protein